SDQERPFVCNAPGCSQRFPTEDHLMIHRHKHEMTPQVSFHKERQHAVRFSDQTPTPTRFLKNCEEVGLFSELDCSIEQEFCKAQEEEDSKQVQAVRIGRKCSSSALSAAKDGPSSCRSVPPPHVSGKEIMFYTCNFKQPLISAEWSPISFQVANFFGMGNHETSIVIQQALPSPQSSSVITQAPSTNRQIGPVPGSLSSLLHLRNRQRQPLPASMAGTLPDPTMPGSSAVLMPLTHPELKGRPFGHGPGPVNGTGLRYSRAWVNQPPNGPGWTAKGKGRCSMRTFSHRVHPAVQMSPATQQMQPTQTLQSPPPSGGRRRRVVDEDPDERRRKFLERNRAAATRCRQKRKVWVMSLEKKAEELTQTNMQLQNEVTMLKNEVTQLKQLLLTHKDCPITTMQKESQGYLSPESSPAGSPAPACSQQQVIQHNTITTS
uniref:Cyclic AMP-responsive element-binding protein 5 n=1 Tax=Tetraodon nigroviridis TaxID=99883 RepID=H3C2P3_TETNG